MALLISLSLSLSSISAAQETTNEISEGFKKLAPTAKIAKISATPIKGIKQINLESGNINDVYYMTDDGKYLINGSIIETNSQLNLTENSKLDKRHEIVSQFKESQRIDFYPKDKEMKHHITVYTDIDCGYCRKLHKEMKQYNDLGIGISYLMWPRSGIGSASYDKAVTKSQNGEILKPLQCDNPIKAQYLSGVQIGVRGTPNIVTDKGELIPTYMPAQALFHKLEMLAAQNP
jgi:thiol:disulfide interchange protein DsbC